MHFTIYVCHCTPSGYLKGGNKILSTDNSKKENEGKRGKARVEKREEKGGRGNNGEGEEGVLSWTPVHIWRNSYGGRRGS